ncbi:hypothetical protein BDC45DRAFT_510564 [Circinella umbellata]|nr:hypothetical protein BDC45DRAFT_510564 [Circinella umbellata]
MPSRRLLLLLLSVYICSVITSNKLDSIALDSMKVVRLMVDSLLLVRFVDNVLGVTNISGIFIHYIMNVKLLMQSKTTITFFPY